MSWYSTWSSENKNILNQSHFDVSSDNSSKTFLLLFSHSVESDCNSMYCSMSAFLDLHCFPEFVQIHVLRVSDAVQLSHPLLPSSLFFFFFNLSQHKGLLQWVDSSHQVAKVLELQLEQQSLQWIFKSWFPLGLTGLISLLSKRLPRVFSSTTIRKH